MADNALGSILAQLQGQAQPRPDLITPGSTGVLENARPATFMGRMVQPGDTLSSVMARFPVGEADAGGMGMDAARTLAGVLSIASPEAIRIANRTSRAAGAVGGKALVPKAVEASVPKNAEILDYGAGKTAAHAAALKEKGYKVTAHDFGDNVKPGIHDAQALSRQYDHVYASNVLNVQSSPEMLGSTLDEIFNAVKPGGSATVNLPAAPRKFPDLNASLLESELQKRFKEVKKVGGSKSAPVFQVVKEGK